MNQVAGRTVSSKELENGTAKPIRMEVLSEKAQSQTIVMYFSFAMNLVVFALSLAEVIDKPGEFIGHTGWLVILSLSIFLHVLGLTLNIVYASNCCCTSSFNIYRPPYYLHNIAALLSNAMVAIICLCLLIDYNSRSDCLSPSIPYNEYTGMNGVANGLYCSFLWNNVFYGLTFSSGILSGIYMLFISNITDNLHDNNVRIAKN